MRGFRCEATRRLRGEGDSKKATRREIRQRRQRGGGPVSRKQQSVMLELIAAVERVGLLHARHQTPIGRTLNVTYPT